MRTQTLIRLSVLIALLLGFSLLLTTSQGEARLAPHPSSTFREDIYVRSVAIVWALDSIEDDVSCHDALRKYQRDFHGLPSSVRAEIIATYEDLMGNCNDNDPPKSSRARATAYLRGVHVKR